MSQKQLWINQERAIESVLTELESKKSTLVVMPMGTGKTVVFAKLVEIFYNQLSKRCLILADRKKLVRQAVDKILSWTGFEEYEVDIEMGTTRSNQLIKAPIVAGTVQSVCNRLAQFDPDDFCLIIIDECDKSLTKQYREVIDYFSGAKIVGLTATAKRLDGQELGEIYESIAYVYELRDAIKDQKLVPIYILPITIEGLDLSSVRITSGGDYDESALDELLTLEKNVHLFTKPIIDNYEKRQTLVFCTSIDHTRLMCEVLNRRLPNSARFVDGTLPEDYIDRTIKKFEAGEYEFLCCCELLTRGVDIRCVACIALCRPTLSWSLFWQMVGRGTRLLGDTFAESIINGKADLIVLDMVGNSAKHGNMSTLQILADGNDERVLKKAAEILLNDPKNVHIIEALELAEEFVKAADKEIEFRRFSDLTVDSEYTIGKVENPFALIGAHVKATGNGHDVTENQERALLRAGFHKIDIALLDKEDCGNVIEAIVKRYELGLCTYKQAKMMVRFGFDPDISYGVAKNIIDAISRNKWSINDEIKKWADSAIQTDKERQKSKRKKVNK